MLDDLKQYPLFQDSDGLLYHFDENRGKWLSVNRETMSFCINAKNIKGKRYMAHNGNFYSNVSGKSLIRDSTITSISIQTDNLQCTFDVNIHKNKEPFSIYTINLNNVGSKILDDINFDLNKGDFIQLSMENSDIMGIRFPEILIEYCWRRAY